MKSSDVSLSKILLQRIAFFLFMFLISMQISFAQKLRFGLKGSPTVSWMKPDYTNWKSDGIRLGFNYGIITEFGFTDNYFLATGVDISHRGGKILQKYDSTGISVNTKLTYKLQYLDIPLTLKMKTNEIGYMTYFGQFGLVPSVLLKARGDSSVSVNGVSLPDANNRNFSKKIIPVSLALCIGVGMEYSIAGKTSILAGITFNNGFTDVLTNEKSTSPEKKYKSFLNSFVLNTGIIF